MADRPPVRRPADEGTAPGDRPAGEDRPSGGARSTRSGVGRVLIAVYAVFTLAAGARAGVQIATRYHEAPLAYTLSAFAALVYLLATVALIRGDRASRRLALAACSTEAVGVLVVGTLSLLDAGAFPDDTVWSGYGRGYGFVPLVLPFLGLAWLRRTRRG